MSNNKNALSLTEQIKKGITTIKEEKKEIKLSKSTVLLLDISFSMKEMIGDKRSIDHLRNAVSSFPGIKKIVFSDCSEIVDYVPEPRGSTELASAIEFTKLHCPGIRSIVLISDGEPNNKEASLSAGKKAGIPINVIYIGEKGSRGEQFLIHLAEITGGKQITANKNSGNSMGQQIKEDIKLMLPKPGE